MFCFMTSIYTPSVDTNNVEDMWSTNIKQSVNTEFFSKNIYFFKIEYR